MDKEERHKWLVAFVWAMQYRIEGFVGDATVDWIVDDLESVLDGNPDGETEAEYVRLYGGF